MSRPNICQFFGHNWVFRPHTHTGDLVCSVCGTVAD